VPSLRAFDFTWMGPRVPTILVSPYLTPGTVFRKPDESKWEFDHTSFIATILKWAGIDPTTAKLGQRVAVAPTFEGVLTTTRSTRTPPTFTVPADYQHMGGTKGPHNIPFDFGQMHIREWHRLFDHARSAEEFLERLRPE
jgi:phospholipase C